MLGTPEKPIKIDEQENKKEVADFQETTFARNRRPEVDGKDINTELNKTSLKNISEGNKNKSIFEELKTNMIKLIKNNGGKYEEDSKDDKSYLLNIITHRLVNNKKPLDFLIENEIMPTLNNPKAGKNAINRSILIVDLLKIRLEENNTLADKNQGNRINNPILDEAISQVNTINTIKETQIELAKLKKDVPNEEKAFASKETI